MDLSTVSTLGHYHSTLTEPRIMQFGLRYDFQSPRNRLASRFPA